MVRCTTSCHIVLNSKGIGPSRRVAQANSLATAKNTGNFQRCGRSDARSTLENQRIPGPYGQIPDAVGTGNLFGRTGNSNGANGRKTGNLRRFAAGRSQAPIPLKQIRDH
jgi:hypothetical protein